MDTEEELSSRVKALDIALGQLEAFTMFAIQLHESGVMPIEHVIAAITTMIEPFDEGHPRRQVLMGIIDHLRTAASPPIDQSADLEEIG